MLTQFTVENFKSYKKATIDFAPLTLLIGANASGKSNLIEAIDVLSQLADDKDFDDIVLAESSLSSLRGAPENLCRKPLTEFALGAVASFDSDVIGVSCEFMVHRDGGCHIIGESVVLNYRTLFKATSIVDDDIGEIHGLFVYLPGVEQIDGLSSYSPAFVQLANAPQSKNRSKEFRDAQIEASALKLALERILILDPVPAAMRTYTYASKKELTRNGSNVSATLFDIRGSDAEKEILDFVSDLPEQEITGIQFIETARHDVMLQLEESFGGISILQDAAVLSDGTLRVLAIAAALYTVVPTTLLIIEEIDNGIHPSRAKQLLTKIHAIATQRGLRVLVTSHNPALMDALPEQALPDVVFCYRDPTEGDSRLVRLQDLDDYPSLMAQGPLGRLVTQGILDRVVKDRRSREERKAEALAYVHQLESSVAKG